MKTIQTIEEYLDGSLNSKKSNAFREKMSANKQLKDEVELHRSVNEAIKDDALYEFRQNVKKVITKNSKRANKQILFIKTYIKYPVAAGIVVILGLSIWKLTTRITPSEVFNEFYKPYQTDISTRSVNQSANSVQLSYILYQEKDYEASSEILKNYLSQNYNDITAHFYYGMNALELKNYKLATTELLLVANDRSTPFKIHAQWYLAMTYLKMNKRNDAENILEKLTESDNIYTNAAKKVIRKL
ncbi:MAG: hypothetical protein JW894_06555 [Bacteroidales bacterium]|nr:hypothetical protein [Bacteroidales bacterium]